MEIQEVRYEGNSKFMWDGETYNSKDEADAKKREYEGNKFEVRIFDEEDKYFVYTRREVTEIVLDGEAPV